MDSAALLRTPDARVGATLARFGPTALSFAHKAGITVVVLTKKQRYDEASNALARLGVRVDDWPAAPAGLFVVEERTVYLRSRSPMTVAHEFGHALDCALGGGVYRSGICPKVRKHFNAAREYVTPYASTGLDEYFAEAMRAYVEANDSVSLWPRVTRARLRRIDPPMYAYVDRLFAVEFRSAA
jgi:hypothetical protein